MCKCLHAIKNAEATMFVSPIYMSIYVLHTGRTVSIDTTVHVQFFFSLFLLLLLLPGAHHTVHASLIGVVAFHTEKNHSGKRRKNDFPRRYFVSHSSMFRIGFCIVFLTNRQHCDAVVSGYFGQRQRTISSELIFRDL